MTSRPRSAHPGAVVWLTGLPGAGKTTIARGVAEELSSAGYAVCVLDGDAVRKGLNADLGFSPEDRTENVRRVAHVAALFADAGLIAIAALVSPYRSGRAAARAAAEQVGARFYEVFVDADLETCASRDPKGLYRRARAGQIADLTGVDAPYEPPLDPDLVIDTASQTVAASVGVLRDHLRESIRLARRRARRAW